MFNINQCLKSNWFSLVITPVANLFNQTLKSCFEVLKSTQPLKKLFLHSKLIVKFYQIGLRTDLN